MIKLTRYDGSGAVYVQPDNINYVSPHLEDPKVTLISFGHQNFANVSETPEEVVRKIMQYKWSMERYKAGAIAGNEDMEAIAFDHLFRLAGLEQTP